ncbi:hypothetical protein MKX07_003256 [Trichoderma sp. CBMAI-0711]|uniref:Transcription factor domain-containing protein n=1 Tax=Trichoderma parareesei TaxID=858221 RepID=A0A2H2YZ59_TRIPA|nr:hypothetical protein MKX07_003256 [Trichoderma sp. CBMAI-0711]OTA01069.1 hypothetical protein A9Z42_0013790 [Trichoderma parareesei]
MNSTELDRTFVNLTDDPAEGRGARRTYIRRAVMKNYHKRRDQKRKASRYEVEVAAGTPENAPEASMMPKYLVNSRPSPQMCALVSTLGTWELLSAAQAVAVYVLLRIKLGKNSRAFPNGDIALLYTLGAIFRRLQVEGTLDVSQHPQGDWKQWVFCETFVRVATVYFTLNAVISMEIGLPCNSPLDWDTEGMLLPASKASWSAQSVDDWKRRTSTLSPYKQLKWKDLLASTSLEDCPVEEWRESSDEMGLLVTMAMTLRAQLLREAVEAGIEGYDGDISKPDFVGSTHLDIRKENQA